MRRKQKRIGRRHLRTLPLRFLVRMGRMTALFAAIRSRRALGACGTMCECQSKRSTLILMEYELQASADGRSLDRRLAMIWQLCGPERSSPSRRVAKARTGKSACATKAG